MLFDNVATQLHSKGNSSGEPADIRITLGSDEIIGWRYVGNSKKVGPSLPGKILQMLRECTLSGVHIATLLRELP
jgi:hypothetical protein